VLYKGTGAMRVDWLPEGGALRIIIVGHGDGGYGPAALKRWDAALAFGNFALLADFSQMNTYDSALRVAMTGWCVAHRGDLNGLHIFVTSKIVAMGVAVANIALKGLIKVHDNRMSFDILAKKLGLPLNVPMPA
jgi:hypothetical protein